MTASLETRALEKLVEPLLEVGELGEIDTSPFCWMLGNGGGDAGRKGDLLALETQPQMEMSAMVTLSPTM
jgi:hypothetical protein